MVKSTQCSKTYSLFSEFLVVNVDGMALVGEAGAKGISDLLMGILEKNPLFISFPLEPDE